MVWCTVVCACVALAGANTVGLLNDTDAMYEFADLQHVIQDLEALGVEPVTSQVTSQATIVLPHLHAEFLLPPEFQAALREWVHGGGVFVSMQNEAFLNDVFNWSLGGRYFLNGGLAPTPVTLNQGSCWTLCGGPPELPATLLTAWFVRAIPARSLPAGAAAVYIHEEPKNVVVAAIPYGMGEVIHFGFDWRSSDANGRGAWRELLGMSLVFLTSTSTTRTVTTMTVTAPDAAPPQLILPLWLVCCMTMALSISAWSALYRLRAHVLGDDSPYRRLFVEGLDCVFDLITVVLCHFEGDLEFEDDGGVLLWTLIVSCSLSWLAWAGEMVSWCRHGGVAPKWFVLLHFAGEDMVQFAVLGFVASSQAAGDLAPPLSASLAITQSILFIVLKLFDMTGCKGFRRCCSGAPRADHSSG